MRSLDYGWDTLGHANLIRCLLSGTQLRYRARAGKNKARKEKQPNVSICAREKNIPGPEARKSSNRHNVFISCAAQPTHLRTKKKHLPFGAVLGPRQIVRAQDSKPQIKFACPYEQL